MSASLCGVLGALVLTFLPRLAAAQVDPTTDETNEVPETAPAGRTTPTLGVETGSYTEELRFRGSEGGESADTWEQWSARASIGLSHELRLPELEVGVLRSETTLGVGLVIDRGTWPVFVREALSWELADPSTALALGVGVATGVQINFHEPHFSYWEAGLMLGGRWGPVELFWYPHAVVPFTADEREVYGGQVIRRVQPSIAPLHLVLRFRFEPWRF